jgi:hypothetical protein
VSDIRPGLASEAATLEGFIDKTISSDLSDHVECWNSEASNGAFSLPELSALIFD